MRSKALPIVHSFYCQFPEYRVVCAIKWVPCLRKVNNSIAVYKFFSFSDLRKFFISGKPIAHSLTQHAMFKGKGKG